MEILRFALLGLATGSVYALLALGIVLTYRGSGLLNFAQGAIAMFGAYAYFELTKHAHFAPVPALLAVLVLCAALGAAIHLVVLRPMRKRNASPLARVVATLAVLLILQSTALLIYGGYPISVPSLVPTTLVHVVSKQLPITLGRLYILGICLALSAALYSVYRWTSFGRVTAAVAENELAASSFGYSPDAVAAINWAVGSALAGLAGVLISAIIFVEPTNLVLLVVPAMAAALLGGFSSFPLVLAAALALGIAQSEISRYVSGVGWATAAPFVAVIAVLVLRGRGLPLRGFILDRAPKVGSGRIRPMLVALLWGAGALAVFKLGPAWDSALVTTFGTAIICLSIVLLTGYTGQLSLAQFVIAGVGALVAAKLIAHMSFVPAVILGSLGTGAVGALVGLPALRTRGATLAIATLSLASAIVAVVFDNTSLTGGLSGIVIPPLSIFGWSISPVTHSGRYALVVFTVMVAIAIAVANIRRGVTGRKLLAVRSNERAAASLGVSVAGVKVYAFFMAAAIAAIGGVMLAFVNPFLEVTNFDVFTCVLLVGLTVIGGIGYVPGAVFAGAIVAGGAFSQILSGWSAADNYLPLIGAVALTLTLITGPDGWFAAIQVSLSRVLALLDSVSDAMRATVRRLRPERPRATTPVVGRVPEQVLRVEAVSIAFGGVRALEKVSIDVRPGEVHGLIGPNGAGKTTLIDAITGFARPSSGTIRLGDRDISRWSARRRALRGLSRSFQSLELFDDLTVEENLAVACQTQGTWRYLTDMVFPGRIRLSNAGWAAVHSLDLSALLPVQPTAVSYGQRKIVAIARALASRPSILLLDEPAAGLDDTEAGQLGAMIRSLADDWGIGVLLVEHKVDLVMDICDRVTVLEGGRALATGTPEMIQSHPEVLDAYLGVAV